MVKVKICGIKTVEAARAAVDNGASFIGFIFFKGSRRYIDPRGAAEIARSIKGVKKVGVFVDERADVINSTADCVGLDYVQLHGDESAEYALEIERPIIKAWRFGDNFDVQSANDYPCEIVLLDSYVKGQAGGTGQIFNWTAAARLTAQLKKPLLIAGGITASNVSTAIEIFRPYGVDVSGSLEVDGAKSVELIKKFFGALRSTEDC